MMNYLYSYSFIQLKKSAVFICILITELDNGFREAFDDSQ